MAHEPKISVEDWGFSVSKNQCRRLGVFIPILTVTLPCFHFSPTAFPLSLWLYENPRVIYKTFEAATQQRKGRRPPSKSALQCRDVGPSAALHLPSLISFPKSPRWTFVYNSLKIIIFKYLCEQPSCSSDGMLIRRFWARYEHATRKRCTLYFDFLCNNGLLWKRWQFFCVQTMTFEMGLWFSLWTVYFRQKYCRWILFFVLRLKILGERLDRLKRLVVIQIHFYYLIAPLKTC